MRRCPKCFGFMTSTTGKRDWWGCTNCGYWEYYDPLTENGNTGKEQQSEQES